MTRQNGERGTALLEAAFVLPVLLLLIFGAFDIGRLAHAHSAAFSAAREGARTATTDPASATCVRAAALRIGSLASLTAGDVAYTPPASPNLGDEIVVAVSTTVEIITPLVSTTIGRDTAPVRAEARMRIRHVPDAPGACVVP
ncbi:MAG: pilus assembly protein [Chloroflexota bacterium]|nr:MAG: pilus assembly protein [Chloroflexota bacterium]